MTDPFHLASESLRKDIAELIHRHWTGPDMADLDKDMRFHAVNYALTLTLATMLKRVVNAPEAHLIEMIRGSLPAAFSTAAMIIADEADPREVCH